jgi:hypothetical protein
MLATCHQVVKRIAMSLTVISRASNVWPECPFFFNYSNFYRGCFAQMSHFQRFILVAKSQFPAVSYSIIMSNVPKGSSLANDLLKNSSLYREFQAEREEILRHKWIESEKAGHDIGFERALTDWIIRHRSAWRKSRQVASNN